MKTAAWVAGGGALMALFEGTATALALPAASATPLLALTALALLTWRSERWRTPPDA